MTVRRCVIVGDVVDSRSRTDRERLRTALEAGLDRANEVAREGLVAPFAVLKGVDEVGGVLETPAEAYAAIRAIAEALHPAEIRFAVVYGAVDVAPDADDVAVMDGPAFHRADELLATAETDDRWVGVDLGDGDDLLRTLLSDHVDLLFMIKANWTERQTEVVRLYRTEDTMDAVADRLGVSVQAVSQTLQAARARAVFDVEATLEAALARIAREVEP